MKLAQYSLTCCEGCTISLINALIRNPKVLNKVEVVASRIAGLKGVVEADVAIVEGSVITVKDREVLKEIREKSKVLIALGSCACNGGLNALRKELAQALKEVYSGSIELKHLERVEPVKNVVKVDLEVPGCPPPDSEIEKLLESIILGKKFAEVYKTVCYECKSMGLPCFLERGEACLGALTRGGCKALCIRYGQPCIGCRGLASEPRIEQYREAVEKHGLNLDEVRELAKIFLGEVLKDGNPRDKQS